MDIIATLKYLQEFNTVSVLVRLLLAIVLGGFIGLERSKNGRAAGLRTHILVCLGATIASMTGVYINSYYGAGDVSRIAAQVISGIGFVSAGTILIRNKSTVIGLTTAACIWAVGTIGIAIGYGFYEAAIIGALLMFFVTSVLNALDSKLRHDMREISIYIEFIDAKLVNQTIAEIKKDNIEIESLSVNKAQCQLPNGVGVELLIHISKKKDVDAFIAELNNSANVHFAVRTTY